MHKHRITKRTVAHRETNLHTDMATPQRDPETAVNATDQTRTSITIADRETGRQADRQAERAGRQTERAGRQTGRADRVGRQVDRADRQHRQTTQTDNTDRQAGKADRQTTD